MSKKVGGYLVFDFETGGYECQKHAATEIGLIFLDGITLQEVGRFETYIKPYIKEYTQEALTFTGLSLELLSTKGEDIKVVGQRLQDWLKEMRTKTGTTSYTKKPTLVGHNVIFDIGFLQQLAKESKVDFFNQIDGDVDYFNRFMPSYIDTLSLTRLAWGDDETQENFKLETCVGRIGSELADGHKALNDVIGTIEVLIYLTRKMRSSEDMTETETTKRMRVRDRVHFNF